MSFNIGDKVRVRRNKDEGLGTVLGVDFFGNIKVELDYRKERGSSLPAFCSPNELTRVEEFADMTYADTDACDCGFCKAGVWDNDDSDGGAYVVTADLEAERGCVDDKWGPADEDDNEDVAALKEEDVSAALKGYYSIDEYARRVALDQAVASAAPGTAPSRIISRAQAFERYLRSGE